MDPIRASYRRVRPHEVTTRSHLAPSIGADVLAEGARRLGWLGLAYAAGSIFGPFARLVLSAVRGHLDPVYFGIPDACAVAAVVMGVAVFAVSRREILAPNRLLDLGLVFQVVGALGISVREFWFGLPQTAGGSFSIPAESVWIAIYPLLVPDTPLRILLTSLLAASMGPVALVASAAATGRPSPDAADVATYFLTSSYLFPILAYAVARIVHRVSVRLEHARAIGSYELIERIGSGGMGEVWRARHRLLARPAAIKLIRRDRMGESVQARDALVQRFEREARATAALRSIHTIDVYDFGVTDEGDFYYVMDLLEGLNLEQLVRQFGPLEPGRVVYLLEQVCQSLGEAHAHGLVHRDVTPGNIFVCRLGPDDDFVKVLDFGLVKHDDRGAAALTMPGVVTGTPSYLAPEIALGRAVDARADLYSLGCVAYYLLTGQRVFTGDTPVAVALAHVQQKPVPPSARSEFDIPAALDALILQCLAKKPGARPASADTLSESLSASMPPDAWTAKDARAWWEHHQPAGPHAAALRDVAPGVMPRDGGRQRRLNPAPVNS
jgi:eukaryotic-like serine/threonine-protein kinase